MTTLHDIMSCPLGGHDIRAFFTSKGELRFFLPDGLAALGVSETSSIVKVLRKERQIRQLSKQDATETVSRIGLNSLALNSRLGRSFTYIDFLKTLPRQAPPHDAA